MRLARADSRFLLPAPPDTACVLGPLAGWTEALQAAGVHLNPGRPDLVVAPAALASRAAAIGAPGVILEGRGGRRELEGAGYRVERYLPLPTVDHAEFLLPVGRAAPARYAMQHWLVTYNPVKRLRNAVVEAALASGRVPPGPTVVTVGVRPGGPPYFARAAATLGLPEDAEFAMTLSGGDLLSRGAFHLFPAEATVPVWALKFSRLAGHPHSFDRDERGLAAAAAAGPVVASRAPRFLGRFEVAGVHASLETAAVGERLSVLLASRRSRETKRKSIDAVAAWLVEVARATAGRAEVLAPERRRLAAALGEHGLPGDLVERLPPVPSVFQHGDLWADNVLVRHEESFTAVDWEDASADGWPLWDLSYFLTDALGLLDGVDSDAARDLHSVRLWRGELPSSTVLFSWLRQAVDASGVPDDAVGPLVTLHWLSVAHAHRSRAGAADTEVGASTPPLPTERLARAWVEDPRLGPSWRLPST